MARVCIDAGHAGRNVDPGAVNSITGLQEADVTLQVAKKVGYYLGLVGIEVAYTRTEWEQAETDDLDFRTEFSNRWNADLFVS